MKQTITLIHLDGETTDIDINVGENTITDVEITVPWEPKDKIEFELDDKTIN